MSDTLTIDALAAEIRQRFDGINADISAQLDDTRLNELVRSNLETLLASNSDYSRKLRFGQDNTLIGTKYARAGLNAGDVEMLHNILSAAQSIGKSTGPSADLDATFKAISEGQYRSTALAAADDERRIEEMRHAGVFGVGRAFDARSYNLAIQAAAMDTAESGFGSQLVGAQYVGELWEAARRESRVFNLIDQFQMTAPSTYVPVEVDIPEMTFQAENTADNSSEYTAISTGSQRVLLTAKKFIIHQMWSGEMEEDSIIPFIPFLRRQATLSVAYYSDSLVLNGDTTNAATGNINLVDADPADTKHYLAFDGIRKVAITDNTGNKIDIAGAISLAQLNNLRGKMIDTTRLVDWGHPIDPNDLVYLADPETADKCCLLDEVVTVDKYGANAGILTGEQSKILGHPLISTIAMSKTDSTGNVSTTAGNNTKGQVAVFNRRGFKTGWRRQVQVETERLPARDQTRIVYSLRMGFGRFSPTGAASGIEAAAVGYDISL